MPRTYFRAMAAYWLGFGLVTTFAPGLMDLFQTPAGIAAKTEFSNHVWFHGGLDILSVSVLLVALSQLPRNRAMLWAAAVVALCPTIAIFWSLLTTPYWSLLFAGSGLGCAAFAVWGAVLARSE